MFGRLLPISPRRKVRTPTSKSSIRMFQSCQKNWKQFGLVRPTLMLQQEYFTKLRGQTKSTQAVLHSSNCLNQVQKLLPIPTLNSIHSSRMHMETAFHMWLSIGQFQVLIERLKSAWPMENGILHKQASMKFEPMQMVYSQQYASMSFRAMAIP